MAKPEYAIDRSVRRRSRKQVRATLQDAIDDLIRLDRSLGDAGREMSVGRKYVEKVQADVRDVKYRITGAIENLTGKKAVSQ